MTRRLVTCARCSRVREHATRGLCNSCYVGIRRSGGALTAWPKPPRPPARRRALADPSDHDPVAVAEAIAADGKVRVEHPADRARVVELTTAGALSRSRAARVLHCSGTTINRYITEAAA